MWQLLMVELMLKMVEGLLLLTPDISKIFWVGLSGSGIHVGESVVVIV